MTTSERWGGFSDEVPRFPPGDEDPWGRTLKFVVLVLFVLLVAVVIGSLGTK